MAIPTPGAGSGNGRGPPPADRQILRAIDGNWYLESQIRALSIYRANLCLENTVMPYYFTEKFVNAARAGCVPIYHAHPTVREGFLKGAQWIDPADFKFDVSETISAALDCNARSFRESNWQWLRSEQVAATEGYRVWTRIVGLVVSRISRSSPEGAGGPRAADTRSSRSAH